MTIQRGDRVEVRSAFDEWLERRALGGPEMAEDFVVVWVCPEWEWRSAEREGREPEAIPWPVEAVRPA